MRVRPVRPTRAAPAARRGSDRLAWAHGTLTFIINVTLDGCVDYQEEVADDETHSFFTGLLEEAGAMLWGRVTYEIFLAQLEVAAVSASGRAS